MKDWKNERALGLMLVAGFDHATAGQLKMMKEGWIMKM